MTIEVSAGDVVAFRLRAHHLDQRLSPDGLLEAAGACAVQDSPPGSTLLALHARVAGLTTSAWDEVVGTERSLLRTWCMRGSPYCFPTTDAPVFTTGVLPPTETALRQLLLGVGPALDELGLSLSKVVDLCRAELAGVLAGRRPAIEELGAALAPLVARHLTPAQRRAWEAEGPYAAGQSLGEGVVHFCVRVLTLEGVVCFAPREGGKAPFVLVAEWLGSPLPALDREAARAELLRRYLRCYGPSTRAGFASWLGVRAGDVDPWWCLVEDELTRVGFRGASWLLTEDLPALRSPVAVRGVRLLPPGDPYTQMRDRETIVDPARHRQVWKSTGAPGTVLVDGAIAGTWRPRKSGRRLTLTVTRLQPLSARQERALRDEAALIGPLRGASSVEVV